MPYDLFISYSRRDNERGQVTALKAQIESSFRTFAGRDVRVFFDTHEIAGMDDWRQKIQRSLCDSQVFLAVLSPQYLVSPYCRWEWEDYVRYEAMRQCLGEGVAPVFFVTLPDAADPKTDQELARWIDEIQRRQTFDLRPWHDAGEQALQQAHVRQTLEQLHVSVRERLARAERSRSSPKNLIKHNPAFVGRVRELTELRKALTRNKLGVVGAHEGQSPSPPSTINIQHPAVVQGLGGMGKTELALAYAHAFAWDYPGGRWQIPCEHLSDLRVALLHLANASALNFELSDDEKKNIGLAFERVLRELNRRERCLLILDNVSDPNLLQPEYLDRVPRDGRVDLIATTRLAPRAIPGAANEQTFIAIDELPEEDALALMRSHQPEGRFASQQEDDEARAIVRLLRGFTLAVETAAIYLGRGTAPDACRRFRERLSPDLLRESETAATDSAVAVRHRVRSLEETLALTLQTLTPEALHLLEIASLLPADQIALPWLKPVGAEKCPEFAAKPTERTSAFRQAEELLLGLRLFQATGVVDEDGRVLVVRMHRLVQELVAGNLRKLDAIADHLSNSVVTYARNRAERFSVEWIKAGNRWELAVLVACGWLWMRDPGRGGSWWSSILSGPLLRLAQFAEAEAFFKEALLCEAKVNVEGPNYAVCLDNLAQVMHQTNRAEEAESLMRQALEIDRRYWGEASPLLAPRLNNFAEILKSTGKRPVAEKVLRSAIVMMESQEKGAHPDLAVLLNNLGQILESEGQYDEAEQLFRRALSIDEAAYGQQHPSVAKSCANLGSLLAHTRREREAEAMMRRCVDISRACFTVDGNGWLLVTPLNNLAQIVAMLENFTEAESLAKEALDITRAVWGPTHAYVCSSLATWASCLVTLRRWQEAESAQREALKICQDTLRAEDPLYLPMLGNLGATLLQIGNIDEARGLFQQALDRAEQSFGSWNPEVSVACNNLGAVLVELGKLEEAEPLLRRGMMILLRLFEAQSAEPANLRRSVANYFNLLEKMGWNEQQAMARINEMSRAFGIRF